RNTVESKYYQNGVWVLPSQAELSTLGAKDLTLLYFGYIQHIQVPCNNRVRLGHVGDGGWDMCEDAPYKPANNSLVYSFGIAKDFSFDDAIGARINARVHSFDPTTGVKDHKRSDNVYFHATGISDTTGTNGNGWKMGTLSAIKKELGHENEVLSILKMDIESWEWRVLPQILKAHELTNTKQVMVEFHTCRRCADRQVVKELTHAITILKDLYDIGFRIFWMHKNPACTYTCKYTGAKLSKCQEVYFLKK
ncbi:probable methyltransferase-like protein 24, partial [Patella vulgata]|uniref:probable methyltransferase-like protein 24 n=1 Tax=Patella vulgata TaxID=6465 RepID=UPI0024A8A3D1